MLLPRASDNLLRRGLKLSHLRILAALGDAGQLTGAAAAIGVSQPAASRLVAEIEQIIGHPVHERTGRGIGLTAIGRALALRASRVRMELDDAARDLVEIATGGVGHVRIGAVTGPALDRVLPALNAERQRHPNVTTFPIWEARLPGDAPQMPLDLGAANGNNVLAFPNGGVNGDKEA